MRIKLLLSFLLISSILMADSNSDDPNKDARIIRIKPKCIILEEWKYPGKYSPMMAFDGNINTCIAQGGKRSSLGFIVMFDRPVLIDEIRIMNGFGKSEELFRKNNRAGKLSITFSLKNKILKNEIVFLKDQREFQSLKFNEIYKTDDINFYVWGGGMYKGTTYDDTCITEIEFYYKGKKFEINNTDQLQKDYLKKLEATLIKVFTDREYIEGQAGYSNIYFHKDGTVSFSDSGNCGKHSLPCTSNYVPSYWRLENLRLYTRKKLNEKWKLTCYKYIKAIRPTGASVGCLSICNDSQGYDDIFEMVDLIDKEKEWEEQQKKKSKSKP